MTAGQKLRDLAPDSVLRGLELVITRRLDGLLQGEYPGFLPGQGTELAEGREYVPGDDVRRMDWSLTARTTVPHVRDLIADRELETWLLVDASASMDFGTAKLEKRDLALIAVAAIGFLTERSGNRIGAHILAQGPRYVPARPGRAHLFGLLRSLLTLPRAEPGGQPPSLAQGIETFRRTTVRRGLAVVVSDFLGEEAWERPLRLLARHHQVIAVEIVDPRELSLPDVGLLTIVDPETGRRGDVSTANRRIRQRYAAAAAAQREAVAAAFRHCGVGHLRLQTDRDWIRDIVQHVHTQRRLAGSAAPPGLSSTPPGPGSASARLSVAPAGRAPYPAPGGTGPTTPRGGSSPEGGAA